MGGLLPKSGTYSLTLILLLTGLAACQSAEPSRSTDVTEDFFHGLNATDIALAGEHRQTTLESKPSNIKVTWRNLATNRGGSVMPIRTFKTAGGIYCREFEERLSGIGRTDRLRRGLACRQNGRWIVQENS